MEATTTVWLAKPESPQDAESVAVMRWAIEQDAARQGSLVGECLAAARAAGLSAEDTYVFLAYQALLRLEEQQERHVYLSDIAPFVEAPPSSPSSRGVAARLASHVGRLARTAVGRVLHLERVERAAEPTQGAVGGNH
jgi:hypothetical protein